MAVVPCSSLRLNEEGPNTPNLSRSAWSVGPEVSPKMDFPTTEKQKPGHRAVDFGEQLPGFIIEVYALNRNGTRLHGSSQMAPGARPPPLFQLRDGGLLVSALSEERLGLDTDINVLDAEMEARLLSLGRPLPSQVALYGATAWGKKPLQVAVADGTLSDLAAVEKFANRYLMNSLVPHNSDDFPDTARTSSERQSPLSKSSTPGAAGAAEGSTTGVEGKTGMQDKSQPFYQNYVEHLLSDDPIDEEAVNLASISPQLTSLNVDGCAPTIRQLVANGYLQDLDSYQNDSTGKHGIQTFAVEIMFDEIRTGLNSFLPDIHASAPHGESASVFTITDDVPVDARVDLRNISRVDIDDAYFECDFDITFSWLVKTPPQELISKLVNNSDSPSAVIEKVANPCRRPELNKNGDPESVAPEDNDGVYGAASSGEASRPIPSKTARTIWRPHWSFSNRITPEIGSVVERLTLSERQVMARGMKLKQSVVDSYWSTENLSREELEDRAQPAKKAHDEVLGSPAPGTSTSKKLPRTLTQSKIANTQSSTAMEMLTRRCSSGTRNPSGNFATNALNSRPGNGAFNVPSKSNDPAVISADSGVEGVSELVYIVKCSGLRFSVSFDHMEAFPFDALSLPVSLNFREPHGIYQAHIARTLKAGNDFDPSPDEDSKETKNADLEEKSNRLHKDSSSTSPSELNLASVSKATKKIHPELRRQVSTSIPIGSLETVKTLLESAAKAMSEIKEPSKVAMPNFQPALDLVPIPGRMRLRVSNDYGNHDGITEHRLRSQKWGIEDSYIQKLNRLPQVGTAKKTTGSVLRSDAFMKVSAGCQDVTEQSHRWTRNTMSIKIFVRRKTQTVFTYIYQPMFLMSFVSMTTILTGFGMDLQSSFGDRASITLTLLLTVVATELPEHLKEVPQVKWIKKWAFNFIVCVILKDVIFIFLWWATTYWNSQDIATSNPWKQEETVGTEPNRNNDEKNDGTPVFFSSYDFPWYHRIWFLDGMTSLCFAAFWFWRVFQFLKVPYDEALDQYTPERVRFDAKPQNAHCLGKNSYLKNYILDKASDFLHEHWRAQYACGALRDMLQSIEKAKRESNARDGYRRATSKIRTYKNMHTLNRHESVRKLMESLKNTQSGVQETLMVPPKWKSVDTFENPPPDSTPPQNQNRKPGESMDPWVDPTSGIKYIDINQPLDKLPHVVQFENRRCVDDILTLLEESPQLARSDLASQLHAKWLSRQPEDTSAGIQKSHKSWDELPLASRLKNIVTVNQVVDLCALAHQVHNSVNELFNADHDDVVSSQEFLRSEVLRPLFYSNVRVPVRRGDLVHIKDVSPSHSTNDFIACVVAWQQHSHWSPETDSQSKESDAIRAGKGSPNGFGFGVSDSDDDEMDTSEFEYHGSVFFVRLIYPGDRSIYHGGRFYPRPSSTTLRAHLAKRDVVAVPETALHFPEIRCKDFTMSILSHSDWLFDYDGSCSINDHRCVQLDRGDLHAK